MEDTKQKENNKKRRLHGDRQYMGKVLYREGTILKKDYTEKVLYEEETYRKEIHMEKKLHGEETILRDDYMGKELYGEWLHRKKMTQEIELYRKGIIWGDYMRKKLKKGYKNKGLYKKRGYGRKRNIHQEETIDYSKKE